MSETNECLSRTKALKAALGRFCSGVTIVTVNTGGDVHGMTANAFSSVSLSPPLVLVCVSRNARMHKLLDAAPRYGISILNEEQAALCGQFAGASHRRDVDFAWCGDVPVIAGALAHFVCEAFSQYSTGDHSIFVGQVREFEGQPGNPLIYYSGQIGKLGSLRPPVHPSFS